MRSQRSSAKTDTSDLGKPHYQAILITDVANGGRGRLQLAMVPILTAHLGPCVVADGQPYLRAMAVLEIARRACSAHLRRNPAWINRAADDARLISRDCCSEGCNMKLALGISGDWAPCAPLPIDIVQRGPGVSMHAAAKVDQPRGRPISAVRVYGASTLTASIVGWPSEVGLRLAW